MAALDVDKLKAKVTGFLKGFSASQLVIIGLLTVVAGVGGVVFLKWVTAPTYGVLLAGLDPKDASAVTAKLDADGVSYQLAAGGATVMVPTSSLDAERIAVAAAGLPAGTTDSGWAAFDGQGITSSSFQQQVAYQRALEATLSTSVGQISGIRSAEVHLALPEKRLFVDDQQAARASVLVTTSGSLGDDAIDAITHLVASSVPDLAPADVAVTDSSGQLLTSDGTAGGGAGRADKARASLESGLESRATTMLDSVLGSGHAVVRVNAEMDLAGSTTDTETYDPTKSAVLSEDDTSETYSTPPSPAPGGTITAAQILPTPSPSAVSSSSTGNGYVKKSTTRQNGVSRTVQHSQLAAGGIKRLTVAVVVDRNAKNAPTAAELQLLVSNAVGVDASRGDTISVSTPAFPVPTTTAAAGGSSTGSTGGTGTLTALAPQALGGVLLLLVALGLLRTVRRGIATELSPAEVTAALQGSGATPALTAAQQAAQAALPAGSVPAQRAADDDGDLMSLLEDDDEVAGMLRGWLANAGGDR